MLSLLKIQLCFLCVFLGYGLGQKGYRCLNLVCENLYVSRHVVFLEHISFFSNPSSSHYLTTFDVIKIDLFHIDDTTPTSVPTLELILELCTKSCTC